MPRASLKLAFDTGGTFTDFAMLDADGNLHVHKVLSTPSDPATAVLRGIDELLGRLALNGDDLTILGATTVVTNAVLERKGARTALLTTKGFRDLLRIRTEARYDLYDLKIRYPEPLIPRDLTFGVPERMTADGTELVPVDGDEVKRIGAALRRAGVESVAVCLLLAYEFPAHEQEVLESLSDEIPGVPISLSSNVCPEIREYERTSTTAVNAYTQPIMRRHVESLRTQLIGRGLSGDFYLMTSSGGMLPGHVAAGVPVRLIESGPAAGALAASAYGEMTAEPNLLSFDMGGTTAKLCLVLDGKPSLGRELEVARFERFKKGSGFPLKIQSIEMMEIGAGGGSIASADQLGLLRVGPQSTGASPGPACYGLGGDVPTVTDADLILGYLSATSFLGGEFQLYPERARTALSRLADQLGVTVERCAWGIHDLVNENMSKAAMVHAVECGADPRALTMVAFGGAGPVHAYGVARKLGIKKVICPAAAGVTSAVGLLVAPVAVDLAASLPMPMSRWDPAYVRKQLALLSDDGCQVVRAAGILETDITTTYSVDMRHVGQGHEINVPLPDLDRPDNDVAASLLDGFCKTYEALYGRQVVGSEVEAITWRVRVSGPRDDIGKFRQHVSVGNGVGGARFRRLIYDAATSGVVDAIVVRQQDIRLGEAISGPLVVEQRESTAVFGGDSVATVDRYGNLVVTLA